MDGVCKGAAESGVPIKPLIYAAFGPLISADQRYAVSVNQRLICCDNFRKAPLA